MGLGNPSTHRAARRETRKIGPGGAFLPIRIAARAARPGGFRLRHRDVQITPRVITRRAKQTDRVASQAAAGSAKTDP